MARLTLTDFDEWLDSAVQKDVDDVYALHEAVEGETEFARYKAERAPNGQLFVSYGDYSPWLRLSRRTPSRVFFFASAAAMLEKVVWTSACGMS